MEQNAFANRVHRPMEAALAAVLGNSYPTWKRLIEELKSDLDLDGEEWHSSSVKAGWALRLQKKKRNIVYLGPRRGWFLVSFALGDRAVAAAKQSSLSAQMLKMISQAKRYAEGTAVRIEVKGTDDLEAVKILARIKTEN
jgi:hypothetical protein